MSFRDIPKIGTIVVSGIFTILILYTILSDGLVGSALDTTITTDEGSFEPVTSFMSAFRLFDYVVVFVFLSLIILSAINAYRIRTDRAYILPAIIFFLLTIIIAAIFQEVLVSIVGASAFSGIISSFPLFQLVASNLSAILIFIFVILSIFMYAIQSGGDYYQ